MAAIVVDGLVKRYGERTVVDHVSFEVAEGEVYALLGENGAGKTTTVEILEGHRQRSGGDVLVLGRDPSGADRDLRDRIGIVLQSTGVERVLTVREVLRLYGGVYRRPRPVDELLELVDLGDAADQRTDRLSGGQRRRLDLALGIVGRPALLFLDEPTTGFDPAARRNAWELIRSMRHEGTTIVLTSHYLDEVEQLADRVGVLRAGRLVAEGTPAELTASLGRTTIRFRLASGTDAIRFADVTDEALRPSGDGNFAVTTTDPTGVLHRLTGWAIEHGQRLDDLAVHRPSLEDLFLEMAGGDSTDAAPDGGDG